MTWHRNPLTEDQLKDARRRFEAGDLMSHIARALGVRHDWLKCLLDPEHGERRKLSRRESARRRRATQAKHPPVLHPDARDSRVEVPHDVLFERERARSHTQTVSAFLMGDPLPGRSALDRMQRQ